MAGLFNSGLRAGLIGRTGADERVPGCEFVVVEIEEVVRLVVDIAVDGLTREVELDDEMGDRTGENDACADPGRSGRSLPANLAFF